MADAKDLIQANARELLGDLLTRSGWGGPAKEGDWIGSYQLCEPLGQGGFGTVWRAQQSEPVRREVAVKLINLGMGTQQVLSRFQQERQALAEMNHPCIAHLIEAGVGPGGTPFFAMELVQGRPITLWCEENNASQETRLRLFQQVCEAVHYAHGRRIIHRDLKPTNILVAMVEGRPLPKVIDFGIAKALARSGLEESYQITATNQWLGTPLYMAPEQFEEGCLPDPRTDVYALGVLLYELLAGVPPFDRDTLRQAGPLELKHLIQEQVPERPGKRVRREAAKTGIRPPREMIPADLDWIVMRALEKDRARRYTTAAELAEEIQRFLDHQPVLAGPPSISYRMSRWARRHRSSLIAGTAGAALSGVLAMLLPFWPVHPSGENTKTATATPLASETLGPANLTSPGIHPGTNGSLDDVTLVRPINGPAQPIVMEDGKPFENSLGMKFIPVPGTGVLFCIHKTRQRDLTAYLGSKPWVSTRNGVEVNPGEDDPCTVSYEDAKLFCEWLSTKENRYYRLPTDEEWSIAAGLGDLEQRPPGAFPSELAWVDGHYPWGSEFPPRAGVPVANLGDEAMHRVSPNDRWIEGYDDGFATASPVMSFVPNAFGLYDMAGNVEEWCEVWFDRTMKTRTVRGSCYIFVVRSRLLTSARWGGNPTRRYNGTGFRCVLVPDGGISKVSPSATAEPR